MSTTAETFDDDNAPFSNESANAFMEAMWAKNGARVAHELEMAAWEMGDRTLDALRKVSDEGRLLAIIKNDAKAPPSISLRTQPILTPDGMKIVRVADVIINTDFDNHRLVEEDAKQYVRGITHNISPNSVDEIQYGLEGLALLQRFTEAKAPEYTVPYRVMLLRISAS